MTKPRDWAYSTNPSLKRGSTSSASTTIAFTQSGITTRNTPPKNTQAASNPAITSTRRCLKVSHTKQWRRVAGGEDQRPQHPPPAGHRVEQQTHPPEIDLTLDTGLTVGHPHRQPPLAEPATLHGEAMQRPIRHRHPPAGEQLGDLGEPQLPLDPAADQLLVRHQRLPGDAMTARTGRTHRRADHADQPVGELVDTAIAPTPAASAAAT